ncbi:beta-galactosidase [Arenicella sp. 4NH20-0111]|uniref:glycoside hydrolase 5 family protein n=1 Tax=Arenicella sp. 4NH20-0111 TaxID=3127648 RepID=UPI00310A7EB5
MKYILLFLLYSLFQNSAYSSSDYVKVNGTQLFLGEKPYVFVGANLWYGAYLGAELNKGDRARLLTELDILKKNGVVNLRVLASSERSELERAVSPSMQADSGLLNESLLIGLDYLLSEMSKRDMRAVLYLNNFWQWSGGMSQYVVWANGGKIEDPDVTGDWNTYIASAASFYRSEAANEIFKNYILRVVTRKNTITGKLYSQDPTIMSWELANEPRAGINDLPFASHSPFIDWVSSTAKYIKSLDKNHLVTTGSEGIAGTSLNESLYLSAHSSKYIDYLTVHLWPKNWSWLDMSNVAKTFPTAVEKATAYIDKHIAFAKKLEKPLVLEEFGVERDFGNYEANGGTIYRDAFYQSIFRLIESNLESCGPLVGSNFWGWGGEGRANNKDLIWKAGDNFTGDPPQEPQGLNSVFNTDQSTLKILSAHNKNLTSINEFILKHCVQQ